MLQASFAGVSKDFGGNPVLSEINLEIMDGERIGLVGENGGGKSTLFRLLAGLETPTSGTVARRRNLTIGYLSQEADPAQSQQSVFEVVASASPEIGQLAARLSELEALMADPASASDSARMERALAEYGRVQERFEALGGYSLNHQVEAVLSGLGFGPAWYDLAVGTLSGGEKKLVNLACILLRQPDLLLLDEPDNHLDLAARVWLEQYIQSYPGSVVVISHDRQLLDHVVTRILALEDGELASYAGNYSYYVEEHQRRLLKQFELYLLQRDEIKRLEHSMHRLKEWARLNDKFAGRAEEMVKRIERLKEQSVNKPILERDRIRINLDAERSGKKVLEVRDLGQILDGRILFEPFDATILYGERVGIVGANGSGKTTLLKTMLGLLPPATGEVRLGASVVPGYYAQEQETLPFASTPLDFVRRLKPMSEPRAISFLHGLLFSLDDMRTPIASLSGGEKSRLQIARLMLNDANFLLLDEPTNNLDIASTEVLEAALLDFEGTILTVSHDRYFLDKIVEKIIAIEADGQVRIYPGNYTRYFTQSRKVSPAST
ncbi:MAG TPA: ABC-F family ATP-binding cassette domain-containing protein [Ktedonobacteraceae bacterium]|nr:ABC-F family ATP-binding cassette domain-containing protein [Ktedonobacteraceae bacterium]